MPRRKASTRQPRTPARRKPSKHSPATWNTADDIPLDDEDSFHANRDRILLEGEEDDEEEYEEEVLALPEQPSPSDSEDDSAEEIGSTSEPKHKATRQARPSKSKITENRLEDDSEDDSEDEGWGKKKSAYYSTNAGDLGDDDETNELYLEETLRLQRKALAELSPEDYGVDDHSAFAVVWESTSTGPDRQPDPSPSSGLSLKSLEKACPEAIALARDWDNVMTDLEKIEQTIAKTESGGPEHPSIGLAHLYHQTLLQYTSLLAYYFYLYTSVPGSGTKLRKHPILSRLLLLREAALELEDLGLDDSASALNDDVSDGSIPSDIDMYDWMPSAEVTSDSSFATPSSKRRSSASTKSKKRKPLTDIKSPSDDLVEPAFASETQKRKKKSKQAAVLHFGDATELERTDAQDKLARRKGIQFHAARIDNSQFKKAKRMHYTGGDDDIPYPEMRRQPAVSRKSQDVGSVAGSLKRTSDLIGLDEDPSEEYYRLVKKQKKQAKEIKKAEHESKRESERISIEDDGAEGPRSATRAILANKGLTPKRAKSVRNPRVKKRMKFEKAKQKLSSQKAVYKGGQKASSYGGEQTGISVRTVKSVKFA